MTINKKKGPDTISIKNLSGPFIRAVLSIGCGARFQIQLKRRRNSQTRLAVPAGFLLA
jgi:hypothetical protein